MGLYVDMFRLGVRLDDVRSIPSFYGPGHIIAGPNSAATSLSTYLLHCYMMYVSELDY